MEEILKSRSAMLMLTIAAAAGTLSHSFFVVVWATLSSASDVSSSVDWYHAATWLAFASGLVALGAVALVTWKLLARSESANLAELAGATLATLLIAIGTLVGAASSTASASNVLIAIGIGGWSLLALSRAARVTIETRRSDDSRSPVPAAQLWLAASGSIAIYAIGKGITYQLSERGSSIASAVLVAIGLGGLGTVLAFSRSRMLLQSPRAATIIVGLAFLASGSVVSAVVAGIEFSASATLTVLRIGVSLIYTFQVIGIAVLGVAAWNQFVFLSTRRVTATSPSDSDVT